MSHMYALRSLESMHDRKVSRGVGIPGFVFCFVPWASSHNAGPTMPQNKRHQHSARPLADKRKGPGGIINVTNQLASVQKTL